MAKDYNMSKCCKEHMKVEITEAGAWQLTCTKCNKICGFLNEKYKIDETLFTCRPEVRCFSDK